MLSTNYLRATAAFFLTALAVLLSPLALAGPIPAGITLDTITLNNGITLEYAETGQGLGAAVIFLHGYTDSWFSFSQVLAELPASYHGYALTQRGHGDSDKPPSGYSMSDFADDVIAFMDQQGIQRAAVVGHSMGSVIAQRVALDYPHRVSKLVLIGSGADMTTNPVLLDFAAFVDTLADPIDPAFVLDFQASTVFQPIPAGFLDMVVSESLKVPASVWDAALDGLVAENTLPELAGLDVPTLIVWGDRDDIFPLSDQLDLDAGIPDSSLKVYADTGHGLHWEQPQRFTSDLVHFLRHPVDPQASLGLLSIATVRQLPLGTEVTVEGFVTVPSGAFASSTFDQGFAIEDSTAGIYVSLQENLGLNFNRRVRVTGVLDDDGFGQLVLRPASPDAVETRPGARRIEAEELATGAVGEASEGQLVAVQGTITRLADDTPFGYSVFIDDGSGETQIFIPITTGVNPFLLGYIAVGADIRASGLSGQFLSQYEVLPRFHGDLRPLP